MPDDSPPQKNLAKNECHDLNTLESWKWNCACNEREIKFDGTQINWVCKTLMKIHNQLRNN